MFFLSGWVSLAWPQYPDWFLYPASYPGTVTGFSYFGTPAVTDAERMSCVYEEVVVEGVLELFQDLQRDKFLRNSDYYYYFSPDSLANIRGSLKPLDRFRTNVLLNDDIVLFSADSIETLETRRVDIDSLAPPEWHDRYFWRDGGYCYGVGNFTFRGNENSAWKTAEEKAIYTILTSLAAEYHGLLSSEKGGNPANESMERIQFVKLKYWVRHIEPVERWLDRENDLCMVLVRITEKNIISPLIHLNSTDDIGQ